MAKLKARLAESKLLAAIKDAMTARPPRALIRIVESKLQEEGTLTAEDKRYLHNLSRRNVGLTQGSSLSPVGMLLYMTPLMAELEDMDDVSYVQYADDLLLLLEAYSAKKLIRTLEELAERLGIEFTFEVTRWKPGASFDILGYRIDHDGEGAVAMPEEHAAKEIALKLSQLARDFHKAPYDEEHCKTTTCEVVDLFWPYILTATHVVDAAVTKEFGLMTPITQQILSELHGRRKQVTAYMDGVANITPLYPQFTWCKGNLATLLNTHPHYRQNRATHRANKGHSAHESRGERSHKHSEPRDSTANSNPSASSDTGRGLAGRTARSARDAAAAHAPRIRRGKRKQRPGGSDDPKRQKESR